MENRKEYLDELKSLNDQVVNMGIILEKSIDDVMIALKNMDVDLALDIIKRDDVIDDLEREIEKKCILIISKQAPVASDLRKITSFMRIISDIERIADHCADISEYIILISREGKCNMPLYLEEMIIVMREMTIATIESFVKGDVVLANKVIKKDDLVDNYFFEIKEELCLEMKEKPNTIKQSTDYLMIVKYVERMADHCTNIAGWIDFIVKGDFNNILV